MRSLPMMMIAVTLVACALASCTGDPNRNAVIWGDALRSMGQAYQAPASRPAPPPMIRTYSRTNPDGTLSPCYDTGSYVNCL